MMYQWIAFCIVTVIAYCAIGFFAQLTGGSSTSAWQAFTSVLRPLPILIIVIGNMFFSIGIYYGLTVTRYAIPIATAIGALTLYVYSIILLGADVTALKIVGMTTVIAGIVMIGL